MTQGQAWALAAALLVMTGCTSARAPPCPGDVVATLRFHGELVPDPATCAFPVASSLDFTATLSASQDGSAALCVDRPESSPLVGTLSGNHLSVAGPPAPAKPPPCACNVVVAEKVEGDVGENADGPTFGGELWNGVSLAEGVDAATCEPPTTGGTTGSARCGAPCQVRWTLTATR